jgi:hypothetical protein
MVRISDATVHIDQFVAGLCSIREDFHIENVYDYIKSHPVDAQSLQPYLFFSKNHYTQPDFQNHLFELLDICWEVSQESRIHNHQNQNCWMAVPIGRLRIQNFRVVEQDDKTGYCRQSQPILLTFRSMPTRVDPAEPVHQVLNLSEFNERAVRVARLFKPTTSLFRPQTSFAGPQLERVRHCVM